MTPQEFMKLLRPHAERVNFRTGIPTEVMLAQVALETGWLQYPTKDKHTGRDSKNLFNIKGQGPAGSVTVLTTEYIRGQKKKIEEQFRAYHSYEESFADYVRLITTNQRYAPAMAVKSNPVEFVRALQRCGYATDPKYAEKLTAIMRRYMGVK